MTETARKLFEEAMRLDPEERAALAGLLLESLEPEAEEGVEQAWVAEVERRMAELDSGAVQPIAWEELRARL
jgi:putative addiction module component (TIGR02574 family)